MDKKKIIIGIAILILAVVAVLGIISIVGTLSPDSVTVSPAAVQTRRMWQSDSRFGSSDYVPEEQGLLYGGRAEYVRFASEKIDAAEIKKATLKINARAYKGDTTPFLAAVAISDFRAVNVETNLRQETPSLRTAPGETSNPNHQFVLANDGMYAKDVISAVAAYEKGIASESPVKENIYSENGITFDLPVTFELDVTDAVKNAFKKNNHVQFALIPDKNVIKVDGANEAQSLSLSSDPLCGGNPGYYSSIKTNPASFKDEFFSWIYIPENAITLKIEHTDTNAVYKDISKSADAGVLGSKINSLSHCFDSQVWTAYNEIRNDSNVNDLLLEAAKKTSSLKKFVKSFNDIVTDTYSKVRKCEIEVNSDLGGARGTISISSALAPEKSFAVIKTYDASNTITESVVALKDGRGYYNVFNKNNPSAKIEIAVATDEAGQNIISDVKTITPENIELPELFITEISNQHTNTYYPDPPSIEHTGTMEQNFQYIELTNYNDEPVDLKDYSLVYNNGTDHTFDWIFESKANSVINPGDVYVIGVYSSDSAKKGYAFDSDSAIKKYWEDFGSFYNTSVPVKNRVLIACVESGKPDVTINGIDHLERSRDIFDETGNKLTVTARIMKGSETVTAVALPDENPGSSYSYQFIPSGKTADGFEQFLFGSGCFPNRLMNEQKLDYCEKVYFSDTEPIKVMSYNILAKETQETRIIDRAPLFFRTIDSYQPDIIGLQEVNHIWVAHLNSQMPSHYSLQAGVSSRGNEYNSLSTNTVWDTTRPIYFRNDKFDLIEGGTAFLTPDGKVTTKVWDSIRQPCTMTWVSLKNKETKEVINVINTHNTLSGDVARTEQVKLLHGKGSELKAKHGGGIVILGDHNFYENSEPYHEYINNGNLVDTRYETTDHYCISTCTTFGSNDKDHIGTIDFCFTGKDDYVTQRYEVFDGVYPEGIVSDHSAVYAEIISKDRVIDDTSK